jgi:protein-S-isoprenylcysteine O-methyltransferase Ste14
VALFIVSWQWGRADWLPWMFPLGVTLAAIGLLLRVWATGWLIKNEALTTSGPYSLTRNPLYLGTLLITTGQCLMSDVPWAPLFFPALCLALYWTTIRQEESYLRTRYGAEYEAYAQRVPLLLPTWKWALNHENFSSRQEFSWKRVRRCYKGFLANAVVIFAYVLLHFLR